MSPSGLLTCHNQSIETAALQVYATGIIGEATGFRGPSEARVSAAGGLGGSSECSTRKTGGRASAGRWQHATQLCPFSATMLEDLPQVCITCTISLSNMSAVLPNWGLVVGPEAPWAMLDSSPTVGTLRQQDRQRRKGQPAFGAVSGVLSRRLRAL